MVHSCCRHCAQWRSSAADGPQTLATWSEREPGRCPFPRPSPAARVRQLAGDDGRVYLEKLHEIALAPHRDTRSRLAALAMLLERGWGKPRELVEMTATADSLALSPEAVSRLSDADLEMAVTVVHKLKAVVALEAQAGH